MNLFFSIIITVYKTLHNTFLLIPYDTVGEHKDAKSGMWSRSRTSKGTPNKQDKWMLGRTGDIKHRITQNMISWGREESWSVWLSSDTNKARVSSVLENRLIIKHCNTVKS